jgi:hypothetical protein
MSSEYTRGGGTNHHYSELDSSADSSAAPSRSESPGHHKSALHIRRGRVRFNSTSEANDATNKRSSVPLRDRSLSPSTITAPKNTRTSPLHSRSNSYTNLLRRTPESEKEDPFSDASAIVLKPKPSVLRTNSGSNITSELEDVNLEGQGVNHEKAFSALAAQERAQRVASLVGSHSAPTSARTSMDEDDLLYSASRSMGTDVYPVRIDDIPLVDMETKRTYDGTGYDIENDLEMGTRSKETSSSEAHKLVRAHTKRLGSRGLRIESTTNLAPGLVSGQVTPTEEQTFDEYVPRPQQYVFPVSVFNILQSI